MPMFIRKKLHRLLIAFIGFMVKFTPGARHTVFAGSGSSRQLCEHIIRTGVKKVLVVTDKPLRELGVLDQAISALHESSIDLAIYDGVLPDPTFEQVQAGAAMAKAQGSEAVVAVGGGSAIDAAKIIAAAITSDESPQNWVGFGKLKHDLPPIYAIPTTSGTGSEATMGAVIKNTQTHEKNIISGGTLLPAAAALDADLIAGLPPHITAATGMDALTHGIEAYIGIWDRGTRKEDARIAVKLVFENLASAYHNGADKNARNGMAMGAYYAGLAINQVNVGNVHAIAHQLGGKYGIPHGLANALVLPHILEFCCEEAQTSLAELAVVIGAGAEGESESTLAHKFIQAVKDLRTEVGISDQSEKIQREDFSDIANLAIAEGGGYPVPRLLDTQDVLLILNKIAA